MAEWIGQLLGQLPTWLIVVILAVVIITLVLGSIRSGTTPWWWDR